MIFSPVLMRYPKWVIAAVIALGSTTLFCFWWFVIKPRQEAKEAFMAAIEAQARAEAEAQDQTQVVEPAESFAVKRPKEQSAVPVTPPSAVDIDATTMLLGGKNLYQVAGNNVILVRENFLQSPIKSGDQAVFHETAKRLVLGRGNGAFEVIQTNGQTIAPLHLHGGGKFDGYLAPFLTHAVYVKNGDIWRGGIDWENAEIVQEKQVTNLGYFQGNPLKGRLVTATGKALLYRDPRYGLIAVNVATGETDSGNLPTDLAISPDGRLALGVVLGNPPQLGVFDNDTFETQTYPIPLRIQPKGLTWLSPQRAALILGNQVLVYDHSTKKLTKPYQTDNARAILQPIAPSLVGEEFLFFLDTQDGVLLLNTETEEIHQVRGPTAHGLELLPDGRFLLSSDLPASEQRGTWLGSFGEENLVRLFAQPLHRKNAPQQLGQRFTLPLAQSQKVIIFAFERWHLLDMSSGNITDFEINGRDLIPIQTTANN